MKFLHHRYNLQLLSTLPVILAFILLFPSCAESDKTLPQPENTYLYSYEVVRDYPHDPEAFTQGLVYDGGFFYEGTGLYGRSSLRKTELISGDILMIYELPEAYFGEGITIFGDKIFQLTWRSNTGFIYSKDTFERLGSFNYGTQGWGITRDDHRLIMCDGSSFLFFLDPVTLEEVARIQVHDKGIPVVRLNELEFIEGKIYANIWQTDYIVIIDPATGQVLSKIDYQTFLSWKIPADK